MLLSRQIDLTGSSWLSFNADHPNFSAPLSHPLKLKDYSQDRPEPSGLEVLCKLEHFAIIIYAVDPERLKGIMPLRFALGTYRDWHKQVLVRAANLVSAKFELLSRMGLVTEAEQQLLHSVLIKPNSEITIYLPRRLWCWKFKRSY